MVEDNHAGVRLMREAFLEVTMLYKLNVVKDGVEAMAYLRREGQYAAAARPGLIMLDLNLPRKDGREVLAEIKADPELRRIPVIVLTSSRARRDMIDSYNLHANCYVVKPVDFDRFVDVIRAIERFWLDTAALQPT
jgi:CheY-like chemotaxis protein